MPEARDNIDGLTVQGVVLSLGGSADDPKDPVVRLRGQKPQFSPAPQRHLLTSLGRVGCPAPVAGWAQEAAMDFPDTDTDGAPRIRPEQVIWQIA